VKVSTVLKSIANVFSASSNKKMYSTITKANILAEVEDTRWSLSSVDSVMSSISEENLRKAADKALDRIKWDKDYATLLGKPVFNLLSNFMKKVERRSLQHDDLSSKLPIKTIEVVNKRLIKMLDDLATNADLVLTHSGEVEVRNTQISHGLYMGVLQSAKMWSMYTRILIAVVDTINLYKPQFQNKDSSLRESPNVEIPRYMLSYLEDYADSYIDILNKVAGAPKNYSIIKDITNIRSNGLDFKFSSGNTSGSAQSSKMVLNVIGISNPFLAAWGMVISTVGLPARAYVDMRHEHYTKIKEEKKWLETHIALMKMDMEGVDPNSPEYLKYRKMLDYYTDRIAEMDKKLSQYNNSN